MRNSLSIKSLLVLSAITGLVSVAGADVTLPGVFGNHMVVQREAAVPVWGWGEAGEKITVTFGEQSKSTVTGADGKWSVQLDALKAGGPLKLTVRGNNTVEITDVLVGEVGLCSGQSNMAMTVARCNDYAKEREAATLPKIRQFSTPRRTAMEPQDNCDGQWAVCSPGTVGMFSGTAFFFGRALHEELDVPVGLINSSVGGTPIEAWTGPKNSGMLYNGMIAPLVPYAIRGAIWYQGERNTKQADPRKYADSLSGLIGGWRSVFDRGEFPFYYVQLPNFKAPQTEPVEDDGWVLVQEAMLKTLACPNTGMAVTIDVGDAKDIHPKNKQAVGRRLALWALAQTYGKDIVCCGPIYKFMTRKNDAIVISFDHIGDGLMAQGDKLKGFAIAGADKKFVWADARIGGPSVVVRSDEVRNPVAVRYGWAPNPDCNLSNTAGLPASPFRTDDWQP